MKKLCTASLFFAFFILCLVGCTYSETFTDLGFWTDTSNNTYTFGSRNEFSMDGNLIKTSVTEGTGTSTVSNWMFSGLGKTIIGFNATVKCCEKMSNCGIELHMKTQTYNASTGQPLGDSASYTHYSFEITRDGKFIIRYYSKENGESDWSYKTLKSFNPSESNVKVNDFNDIVASLKSDGNIYVYMNNILMFTIPASNKKFGYIGIFYQLIKNETYSSSNKGECYIKFNSIQKA